MKLQLRKKKKKKLKKMVQLQIETFTEQVRTVLPPSYINNNNNK